MLHFIRHLSEYVQFIRVLGQELFLIKCRTLGRTSTFCTVTALSHFVLPMNQFSANNEIADLMHPPYCSAV
jgi:NADH:ubiquinone oxidoreductase subunit D